MKKIKRGKMKNILITGINGFVGSSIAEKELEAGNNVIGIVRDKNKKSQLYMVTYLMRLW